DLALSKAEPDEVLKNFIHSVVEASRIAELPMIVKAFEDLVKEKEGFIEAHVISTIPLGPDELQKVASVISKDKRVEIHNETDPDILGGMVIRVGNNVVDLSLKSKMSHLAQSAVL